MNILVSSLKNARMLFLVMLLFLASSQNTAAQLAELDIVFVIETTLSFSNDLPLFKNVISSIVDGLQDLSTSTRYALVTFEDFNRLPFGRTADRPYRRNLALTEDTANFIAQVNATVLGHGNDEPASQINALFGVISTRANQKLDFRAAATKIIVMWTDSRFHSRLNTASNYPGPTLARLTRDLTSASVNPPYRFVGLNRDGVNRNTPLATTDLITIANLTNSFAAGAVDCGSGGGDDVVAGGSLVCTRIGGSEEAIQQGFINIIRAGVGAGPIDTAQDDPAASFLDQVCAIQPTVCALLQILSTVISFLGSFFGVS